LHFRRYPSRKAVKAPRAGALDGLVRNARNGGLGVIITVTFWLHSAKLRRHPWRATSDGVEVLPQWPVLFVTVLTIVSVTVPHVSDAAGASKLHELVHSTVLSQCM